MIWEMCKNFVGKKNSLNSEETMALESHLMWAITARSYDDIFRLLNNGINVNFRLNGISPLIEAVKSDWSEIVELLLDFGADPELADDYGLRAMDYAGRSGIVLMLLGKDCEPRFKGGRLSLSEFEGLLEYLWEEGLRDCIKNGSINI